MVKIEVKILDRDKWKSTLFNLHICAAVPSTQRMKWLLLVLVSSSLLNVFSRL